MGFQGGDTMDSRFDPVLFATALVALAVLLSLSSVARFPAALRPAKAVVSLDLLTPSAQPEGLLTSLR
jgi:hypothetical protein